MPLVCYEPGDPLAQRVQEINALQFETIRREAKEAKEHKVDKRKGRLRFMEIKKLLEKSF